MVAHSSIINEALGEVEDSGRVACSDSQCSGTVAASSTEGHWGNVVVMFHVIQSERACTLAQKQISGMLVVLQWMEKSHTIKPCLVMWQNCFSEQGNHFILQINTKYVLVCFLLL